MYYLNLGPSRSFVLTIVLALNDQMNHPQLGWHDISDLKYNFFQKSPTSVFKNLPGSQLSASMSSRNKPPSANCSSITLLPVTGSSAPMAAMFMLFTTSATATSRGDSQHFLLYLIGIHHCIIYYTQYITDADYRRQVSLFQMHRMIEPE